MITIQTEDEMKEYIRSLQIPEGSKYATLQKHGKKFFGVEFWTTEPMWDKSIKEFDNDEGIIEYKILYNADALHDEFKSMDDAVQITNQKLYRYNTTLVFEGDYAIEFDNKIRCFNCSSENVDEWLKDDNWGYECLDCGAKHQTPRPVCHSLHSVMISHGISNYDYQKLK
jgi:hypothetical protein